MVFDLFEDSIFIKRYYLLDIFRIVEPEGVLELSVLNDLNPLFVDSDRFIFLSRLRAWAILFSSAVNTLIVYRFVAGRLVIGALFCTANWFDIRLAMMALSRFLCIIAVRLTEAVLILSECLKTFEFLFNEFINLNKLLY